MALALEKNRLRLELPDFEGPMELLLYLVRKEEYDIFDLPVSKLVDQYIEYIEMMEELDLEVAGDYLVMSATLLDLKARHLLPREKEPRSEEELTPQEELAYMLIEYEKHHELAQRLEGRLVEESLNFPRGCFPELAQDQQTLVEPNLYDLMKSMKKFFAAPDEFPIKFAPGLDIDERIEEILMILAHQKKALFRDLLNGERDISIVVLTFFAILELCRLRKVKLLQRRNFSNIWVYLVQSGGEFLSAEF